MAVSPRMNLSRTIIAGIKEISQFARKRVLRANILDFNGVMPDEEPA